MRGCLRECKQHERSLYQSCCSELVHTFAAKRLASNETTDHALDFHSSGLGRVRAAQGYVSLPTFTIKQFCTTTSQTQSGRIGSQDNIPRRNLASPQNDIGTRSAGNTFASSQSALAFSHKLAKKVVWMPGLPNPCTTAGEPMQGSILPSTFTSNVISNIRRQATPSTLMLQECSIANKQELPLTLAYCQLESAQFGPSHAPNGLVRCVASSAPRRATVFYEIAATPERLSQCWQRLLCTCVAIKRSMGSLWSKCKQILIKTLHCDWAMLT